MVFPVDTLMSHPGVPYRLETGGFSLLRTLPRVVDPSLGMSSSGATLERLHALPFTGDGGRCPSPGPLGSNPGRTRAGRDLRRGDDPGVAPEPPSRRQHSCLEKTQDAQQDHLMPGVSPTPSELEHQSSLSPDPSASEPRPYLHSRYNR